MEIRYQREFLTVDLFMRWCVLYLYTIGTNIRDWINQVG